MTGYGVVLPKILGEGCVLQQGKTARVWGWCAPGQQVAVAFLEKEKEAVIQERETSSDEAGAFEVMFSDLPAGGPYTLRAADRKGHEVWVSCVYVGDVFVCGGQSNMELPMRRVRERFPEEFWKGGDSGVHLYKVQEHYDFQGPLKDHVQAGWSVCDREALSEISAFSYFMGKELAAQRKVPVGIINLSLGGTPVEAWMSREGLEPWPEYLKLRHVYQDENFRRELMERKDQEEKDWYDEIGRQEAAGPEPFSLSGKERRTLWLPGTLEEAGLHDFCGCLWLRRTFEVSEECAGRAGLLRFGTLTDSDRIYVNGVLVGETGYCYPPRRYPIPEGLLHQGTNEIRVRLICRNGGGRATAGKPYEILWRDVCSDACEPFETGENFPEPIRLAGEWKYEISAVCGHAPEQEFINRRPTGLFQGMTAPCLPFVVSGVVWYQGESNDCRPENYGELLKGFIRDWRKQWRQERLPFVIVQLPNCGVDIAGNHAWSVIREAQRQAAQMEQTAVTVNLDIGEDNDLHPLDKKTAAHRAVLALRSIVYGEEVNWKGPEVRSCRKSGDEVHLGFDPGEGKGLLLAVRDRESGVLTPVSEDTEGKLQSCTGLFELAGEEGVYVPAEMTVRGNEVSLRSSLVSQPVYVRYAWSDTPGRVLLYNEGGLCASSFQIDLKSF